MRLLREWSNNLVWYQIWDTNDVLEHNRFLGTNHNLFEVVGSTTTHQSPNQNNVVIIARSSEISKPSLEHKNPNFFPISQFASTRQQTPHYLRFISLISRRMATFAAGSAVVAFRDTGISGKSSLCAHQNFTQLRQSSSPLKLQCGSGLSFKCGSKSSFPRYGNISKFQALLQMLKFV